MTVSATQSAMRAFGAVLLFLVYRAAEAEWLQFLALVAAIALAMLSVFSSLAHSRLNAVVPPRHTHAKLAGAVGGIAASVIVLPAIQSRFWQLTLLLFAVASLAEGAKVLLLSAVVVAARRGLQSDYRAGRPPHLRVPHVIVARHGEFFQRELGAWLLKLSETLWSTRRQGADEEVSVIDDADGHGNQVTVSAGVRESLSLLRYRWFAHRSLVAWVSLEDIDELDDREREYIVSSAAGTIAQCTRGSLWRALSGVPLENEENLRATVSNVIQQSRLLRTLASMKGNVSLTAADDLRFGAMLHHAPGPVALLVPELALQFGDSVSDSHRNLLHGYEVVSLPAREVSRATPQVLTMVANVSLPLARADRRLGAESRAVIQRIAIDGLAPLADAYLRFRLSASAVERVLSLFDCFEVLIKYSVFALRLPDEHLMGALERPSLGVWTSLLRESVRDSVPSHGDLGALLTAYWRKPLAGAPRELIEAVNGAGLDWNEAVPRSHLAWLDWLVWLRNRTKGHGGLDERTCSPIWHDFHEALLDTVSQLAPLTLDAVIWSQDTAGSAVPMRGWRRGSVRSSTLGLEPSLLSAANFAPVLALGGSHVVLQPFAVCQGNRCLTWNSGDADRAEYIEYATGRLTRYADHSPSREDVS